MVIRAVLHVIDHFKTSLPALVRYGHSRSPARSLQVFRVRYGRFQGLERSLDDAQSSLHALQRSLGDCQSLQQALLRACEISQEFPRACYSSSFLVRSPRVPQRSLQVLPRACRISKNSPEFVTGLHDPASSL